MGWEALANMSGVMGEYHIGYFQCPGSRKLAGS